MAYFRKGVGLVRVPYKTNLQARSANLDFVAGKYLIRPAASGVDVITSVTVNDKSIGKALITNPASLTEVHLPAEYTAIGPKAFDGCSNLESIYVYAGSVIPISEDAIPSGCSIYVDYEFLAEYQAAHPTLTFVGFDSGYTWTVPYIGGVTPTTLSVQYVQDEIAKLGEARLPNVGRIIVPVYFTAYESGSIQAIENAFTNWQHLVSCFESGNVDIEKSSDIYNKIVEIGKTLDEALVYARSMKQADIVQGNTNVIILPPFDTDIQTYTPGSEKKPFTGWVNLVYAPHIKAFFKREYPNNMFYGATNLVEANIEYTADGETTLLGFCTNCTSLKRLHLKNLSEKTCRFCDMTGSYDTFIKNALNIERFIWEGALSSFNISRLSINRGNLIDLFNSLGTPSSLQYPTIGATNLAKLTAEDIAIATDKGWVVR